MRVCMYTFVSVCIVWIYGIDLYMSIWRAPSPFELYLHADGENHHSLQKSDSELEYSPGDLTAMTDNASVSGISELTKKKKKGVFSSLRVPKALKGKSHKKKHDLDDSTSAMADSASRDLRFTDSFSDQDFQALRQRLEE